MDPVAVVQMRMGSTRLPGKMMYPLSGAHVLQHVIRRIQIAELVDHIVVATTKKQCDDIIEHYASEEGVDVFRGSEADVLGRVFAAATEKNADAIIRITGDCPLLSPRLLDLLIQRFTDFTPDYASTRLDQTFPEGTGAEIFTYRSFKQLEEQAKDPYFREHVTPYYYEHPNKYSLLNVSSDEYFDKEKYHDRDDIKLTIDEFKDYQLLRRIHDKLTTEETLDIRNVIDYIDEAELTEK